MNTSHVLRVLAAIWAGFLFAASSVQARDQETIKNTCISAFGVPSANRARTILLGNAKRAAVSELFGELITSRTDIENLRLSRDDIRTTAVGFVHVKGNPEYVNGSNFGDVCISITALAKDDDFAKFEPYRINKRACTSGSMAPSELREQAQRKARYQALIEYEPKLEAFESDDILPLFKKYSFPEGRVIPDTDTYCTVVDGIVIPVEVQSFVEFARGRPAKPHPKDASTDTRDRREVGGERRTVDQRTTLIRQQQSRIRGVWETRYRCGSRTLRGTYELSLTDDGFLEGIREYRPTSRSSREVARMRVRGAYDPNSRKAFLQTVEILKLPKRWNAGDATVTFASDFRSFSWTPNFKGCSTATYTKRR